MPACWNVNGFDAGAAAAVTVATVGVRSVSGVVQVPVEAVARDDEDRAMVTVAGKDGGVIERRVFQWRKG